MGTFFLIAAMPFWTQGRSMTPPGAQLATSLAPMSSVTNFTVFRCVRRYFSAVASWELDAEVCL